MKILKINNKECVLKFTTRSMMTLNAKDITLTTLVEDMQSLNLVRLYDALHEGLKFANSSITIDETYELIDAYYEEENTIEELFMIVLEEYSKSMGLHKKFRELIEEQQQKIQ